MEIIESELWLCSDCTIAAVNDDYSGMDEQRAAEVAKAIAWTCKSFGGHLVSNSDSETGEGIKEFCWSPCACCLSRLGGSRDRFSIIGERK